MVKKAVDILEKVDIFNIVMTIYELKRLHQAAGGHFFDRETMRMFGETMAIFRVEKMKVANNRIKYLVTRKDSPLGGWLFNADGTIGTCL